MIVDKIIKKFYKDKINYSPLREGRNGNYIFIHINKTGGTSVAKAIGLPEKNHLTALEIINKISVLEWIDAYKFTVVRNPWDKVLSHYKYRVKTNQTDLKTNPIPFDEWVQKTYGPHKDYKYYDRPKMFQPQVDWLKDFNHHLKIDKIIKFENLAEGYSEIANTLAIESELPHLNKTRKSNYKDYYNQETIEIIADWFDEDIRLFEYSY